MTTKFRVLDLSIELYQECKKIKLPSFMRDQLLRASSSVSLNLSEGNARRTQKDKLKFINIAFASLREVQTIAKLENIRNIAEKSDEVARMLYALNRNLTDTVYGK